VEAESHYHIEMIQEFGRGSDRQKFEISRSPNEKDEYAGSLRVPSREELFELAALLQRILDTTNP
jgi:hypothetical protein